MSRQALGKPVKSAISTINSMAVYKIQEMGNCSQVLLLNVGEFSNYSENQTDTFDITALVKRNSNNRKNMSLLKVRESFDGQ